MIRTILSALWWAVTLALIAITIGATAMLVDNAPGWSIFRAGGLNPVVKMS